VATEVSPPGRGPPPAATQRRRPVERPATREIAASAGMVKLI
jgi:hypothetical protein